MDISKGLQNSLFASGNESQYDASCKNILKDRMVLANILKAVVCEYNDCSVEDIANKYIEPDTISQTVAVEKNLSNITGASEEDSSINEGTIKYDVRFQAKAPAVYKKEKYKHKKESGNMLINLEIDIEGQKKFDPGYPIEKRAMYYGARMLAAEIGDITENTNYGVLDKVYSIWICFNAPDYKANTITRYCMEKKDLVGKYDIQEKDYNLIETVIIRLGKKDEITKEYILDLLYGLFSPELSYKEKIERLTNIGFEIKNVKEDLEKMSGLGAYLVETSIEKGLQQGLQQGLKQGHKQAEKEFVLKMFAKGKSINEIADLMDLNVDYINDIVKN